MLIPAASHLMPLLIALGQALVIYIMWRQKLRSEFPAFFKYLISNAVVMIMVFIFCYIRSPQYPYFYWVGSFITTVLSFWVLYEVFVSVLKPYSAVIDLARMLFIWAGLFLLLVATITGLVTSGGQSDKFGAAMYLLDHSLLLMECGLLLLLLVFEKRLGLSWRSHGMCIALGLGASAAVNLSVSYILPRFPTWVAQLDLLNGYFYLAAVTTWAIFLRLPEPSKRNVLDSTARLLFQRWNDVLLTTPLARQSAQIATAPMESFIPGVERTVDRILAKKMMN